MAPPSRRPRATVVSHDARGPAPGLDHDQDGDHEQAGDGQDRRRRVEQPEQAAVVVRLGDAHEVGR